MEKETEFEPTFQEINEYQSLITAQVDVLTNTYETIDDDILRLKIKAKIEDLIDQM